MIHGQKIIKLL